MSNAVLQMRIEEKTKRDAEEFFNSLGLDLPTAIRLFLRQAVNQQRLPFEILPPQFSDRTLAAIAEAREIADDPRAASFSSAKELFEDCER